MVLKQYMVYYNTGTSIGGLAENTKYFVGKVDDNQFQLYTKEDLITEVNMTSVIFRANRQTFNYAKVESVAVIGGESDEDQVWVIVKDILTEEQHLLNTILDGLMQFLRLDIIVERLPQH